MRNGEGTEKGKSRQRIGVGGMAKRLAILCSFKRGISMTVAKKEDCNSEHKHPWV